MKTVMRNTYRFIILMSVILLVSCNQDQKAKDSQLALVKTTNPPPVVTDGHKGNDQVEKIKRDVSSFPELYDVAVVKGKKAILVAYKVKHLHRFNMKKIEKNVTKMLEKKYPKAKFTVSSDYKIFLEVVRLDEKMRTSSKFNHRDAEKRFNEIVKMTEDIK
uniref:YhcN/YlaJ family sporulation lipoprotein n=2 Tax=Neobacillus citreus TaxID=2833578 RepID=A0A942SWK4_9BACI